MKRTHRKLTAKAIKQNRPGWRRENGNWIKLNKEENKENSVEREKKNPI